MPDKQDKTAKQPKNANLIDMVMKEAAKDYGATNVIMPDDEENIKKRIARLNVIPSGSLSYDRMTGIGGIPMGRIIEVYGKEGAGKSSTLICFAVAAQKIGYTVIYADVEHRLDLEYAGHLGLDRKKGWYLILPSSSDEVFDVIDRSVRTGQPLFIVIDSVSALVSKGQLDASWTKGRPPGVLARDMNDFLKRINPSLSKSGSVLAFTNQERMAIASFGGYKTQTGGKALPYYSTHRISIQKAKDDKIVENGREIGFYMITTFQKTNTNAAPSPRKVCFKYYHGFWKAEELFQIGTQEGVIKGAKSWFEYDGQKFQGKIAIREALETDKKLADKLEKEVRAKWEME